MNLFSYTVRYDYGSAPNPYWGLCTLTICKPEIRRRAKKNDWIVGVGSRDSPIGDISGRVVYAMRVTDKKTLREYDCFCRKALQDKIPKWSSSAFRKRVGDCIYDYSRSNNPAQRHGIHDAECRKTDIGGKYALLSDDFYYFGSGPVRLPASLNAIRHPWIGQKWKANQPFVNDFVQWIRQYSKAHNIVSAEPQLKSRVQSWNSRAQCARCDRKEAEKDERWSRSNRC